ncbi:MAG TPA: hypothetical protein VHZ74_25110, partial [Bryobacteraceae bacterium]|nr:hypothetical protein [Bryobacteraceae bacterium]
MAARVALTAALLAAACLPVFGQWFHYPTRGIPKTRSGAPNLEAPAPRTADHKPDLSGLWAAPRRPCPPDGCADQMIGAQFLDIGFGVKGGLPLQPWAAAILKERTAQNGKDDPTSRCLPGSPVQMHTSPFLRKIIQTPDVLVLMSENSAIYRQIFTDNRPLPEDPWPYWFGYSSGKWEGDTLVVHTNGFRDGLWLDRNGTPMTDAAKMTERFRRPSYGRLEIEITIDDPKAYTAPFTVTVKQTLAVDTELVDSSCLENEKDWPHMVG